MSTREDVKNAHDILFERLQLVLGEQSKIIMSTYNLHVRIIHSEHYRAWRICWEGMIYIISNRSIRVVLGYASEIWHMYDTDMDSAMRDYDMLMGLLKFVNGVLDTMNTNMILSRHEADWIN